MNSPTKAIFGLRSLAAVLCALGAGAAAHAQQVQPDSASLHSVAQKSKLVIAFPITIPAFQDTVYIQDGQMKTLAQIDASRPSCIFSTLPSAAATHYAPGQSFTIEATRSDGREVDVLFKWSIIPTDNPVVIQNSSLSCKSGQPREITIGEFKAVFARPGVQLVQ